MKHYFDKQIKPLSDKLNVQLSHTVADMRDFMEGEGLAEQDLCDHNDSETIEEQFESPRIDQPDEVWKESIVVCRSCKAWKFDGEEFWNYE